MSIGCSKVEPSGQDWSALSILLIGGRVPFIEYEMDTGGFGVCKCQDLTCCVEDLEQLWKGKRIENSGATPSSVDEPSKFQNTELLGEVGGSKTQHRK